LASWPRHERRRLLFATKFTQSRKGMEELIAAVMKPATGGRAEKRRTLQTQGSPGAEQVAV